MRDTSVVPVKWVGFTVLKTTIIIQGGKTLKFSRMHLFLPEALNSAKFTVMKKFKEKVIRDVMEGIHPWK